MTSKRKLEIERIANETRQKAIITGFGIANIFDVCQTLGYSSIRYPLGKDSILGAAIIKDCDYIIFSNSSYILSREIFTVAHEIGHIELKHLNDNLPQITDFSQFDDDAEIEKEANYFAACFLMPEEKLSDFLHININKPFDELTVIDIAKIQSIFNTSFDTALNRLESLKLISTAQKEYISEQKEKVKVSNLLRAVGGQYQLCFSTENKSVPYKFLEWVVYNYTKKLIPKETLMKALAYLDLSIDDVGIVENGTSEDDEDFDLDEFLGG